MILYKYLTVKKADDWLIGENSILLTPPIHLNDLMEFRIRREPADLEERQASFDEHQRETPSSLSFEDYDRAITGTKFMDDEPDDMQRGLSEMLGVVSLTSDPTNELMWAHYGLNSGVAIGYRTTDEIMQDEMKCRIIPMGVALEVNYSNVVVPIKKDFSDTPRRLTTKRLCWSYEKEWRLVEILQNARRVKCDDKIFYALPAKREVIAHVVFGANASEEFIGRMTTWLQGSQAIIQKLKIDPVSNDLVLSEIGRGA